MSSAILYLAIVAIWACVLIPRWLRRDSARGSSLAFATVTPRDQAPGDTAFDEDHAAYRQDVPDRRRSPAEASTPRADVAQSPAESPEGPKAAAAPAQDVDGEEDVPPPLTPEESRRRMLAARRRLLGMLVLLEGAAVALAVLKLAALWVVIPPSVMLTGYMLLLREAAHADAEQARRDLEEAQARARARERARARARAAQRADGRTAPPQPAGATAAARAGGAHEDAEPGRDFAPGLAGKYTPSNAEVIPISERADENLYDQYTANKLRAVGD
jgi:hypothetical protein